MLHVLGGPLGTDYLDDPRHAQRLHLKHPRHASRVSDDHFAAEARALTTSTPTTPTPTTREPTDYLDDHDCALVEEDLHGDVCAKVGDAALDADRRFAV